MAFSRYGQSCAAANVSQTAIVPDFDAAVNRRWRCPKTLRANAL